jgi:hypothetical protein
VFAQAFLLAIEMDVRPVVFIRLDHVVWHLKAGIPCFWGKKS